MFSFHQFCIYPFVCASPCIYLVLCNFITRVDFWVHHHSQDTEQFNHHKDSLCFLCITILTSLPSHLHKWNLHNITFGIGFFIQHISLEIYPVIMCINSLFLFVHILFNHLPVEGHWVVFRFWQSQITIMSIHVQVFKNCSFSPSPCHIVFICSPWPSSWIVNDSTTVFFSLLNWSFLTFKIIRGIAEWWNYFDKFWLIWSM